MKKQDLVHLQVRMNEEVHKKLKETAKKMGLNTSQLMRQIINEFVENPKSKVIFKK